MIEAFKNQKEVQMIVFQIGSEEYCLPITCVQEIIILEKPTHIPKAPNWVEGVINLRGHIIPIIDGKKKFTVTSDKKSTDSRIMVLDINNETVGLIVDAVEEVIHLNTDDIEPPPIDLGEESDFLWGVGKLQNRLLILLNPEKFLSVNEVKDIKKFSKINDSIEEITVK